MRTMTVGYDDALTVTPSDTNDLSVAYPAYPYCKAIYIGATGTLKVTLASGTQISLTVVNPGTIYHLACKRIWATGTSATGIIALY